MLTMKLSVYGHFVGNSYEKKKTVRHCKKRMDGWNILRLRLRRIQILQKPWNELFPQIYYNSDYHPILLEWATFKYVCNVFSQQQFVGNKSVTITGGKSANLNANVLFISLQNRFATWIHFNKMELRNGNHKMLNTNSFETKSTENLRQSTLNGHIIFRCEFEPTRIANELNNHISKWSQKRNQNWFP